MDPYSVDGDAELHPSARPVSRSASRSSHGPGQGPVHAPIPTSVRAMEIRFCNTCGAKWEPAWAACGRCAAREAAKRRTPAAEPVDVAVTREFGAIWSVVGFYALLLGMMLVSAIIAAALKKGDTAGSQFVQQGILAVITLVWVFLYRGDVKAALAKWVHPGWFGLAVGASGVTLVVAMGAVKLIGLLIGGGDHQYLTPFKAGGYPLVVFIFSLAVMPAVFEELAFRGVMLPAMERVLGKVEGLIVVSAMFAILHLSVPSIPHLFVMGLAMGYLRQRTGSLLPGILLHFCHNAWVGLMEWYG